MQCSHQSVHLFYIRIPFRNEIVIFFFLEWKLISKLRKHESWKVRDQTNKIVYLHLLIYKSCQILENFIIRKTSYLLPSLSNTFKLKQIFLIIII